MYTAEYLPRRACCSAAKLRRGTSRVISAAFTVEDDIVREARADGGARIRPTSASVLINLDTGRYTVRLTGLPLDLPPGQPSAQHDATFTGEHFLDADEHRNDLLTDVVVECLRVHELVQE